MLMYLFAYIAISMYVFACIEMLIFLLISMY